ncbi:hypothetical protein GCM10011344_38440 [Dokdonia pacifica]|uniref:Uncharacterized protein n=1 Tax=Dokdonia pacifica TaxID=1627892 RepID=A0A238ZZQ7_9FLAO|nr:hypothetical protein [Dokdonia pacifica]GGG33959.1 hypothetical protein GCM10011344_38440 [Dokdonia pacifica]SNR88254.1 hypothetical protein SAMN06265376_10420 [Dokdonia pacifica]
MTRLSITFLYICFLYSGFSYAQQIDINEVNLQGTTLHKAIIQFINETKNKKTFFNENGYIQLRLTYKNNSAKSDEIMSIYRLVDNYHRYDNLDKDHLFPLFYTYVETKLILIYSDLNIPLKFSEKSKKLIGNLVLETFPKKNPLYVEDAQGNVIIDDKNFVEEVFNINGGVNLIVYGNNSFKFEKRN